MGTSDADEFRSRAKVRMVDDTIRDAVDRIVEQSATTLMPRLKRFAESNRFRDIVSKFEASEARSVPDVKYAAVVSGSSVIADAEMIKEIIDRHPSAIGLDMELFGLYVAAERCLGRSPSVLGVKGVADFGGADKNKVAQQEASRVATEVFKGILSHLEIFEQGT